jgi:hypothetical protein
MYVVASLAAAVVSNVVIALAFLRVVRGMQRQHARERDALIDRVCHLAGRPWNTPPAVEELVEVPRDWESTWESPAPEQMVA